MKFKTYYRKLTLFELRIRGLMPEVIDGDLLKYIVLEEEIAKREVDLEIILQV